MIEMAQDPVRGPDPVDPHEQCERDIEAARRAPRPLSFGELHALVGALVGDRTYAVTVQTWRHLGGHIVTSWRVSWFPNNDDPQHCRSVDHATAAGVYAKLRAELPANPLDEVGDLPW